MSAVLHRCRALLGTLVEMRVEGLPAPAAAGALEAAFEEVAHVHRAMSFHDAGSDLARLHRAPPGTAVAIDARTADVLRLARALARVSAGTFDVTVAAQLVRHGALPRPESPFEPDPAARWHDIELLPGDRVRLRRALWLDLGGIAKGYAVDRAIAVLRRHGATHACINAGGDLRVLGSRAEPVHLRRGDGTLNPTPDLALADGAIATSAARTALPAHFDRTRTAVAPGAAVTVIAPRCVLADALTKVALGATPAVAARALRACAAQAYIHGPVHGWQPLESAA